MTKRKNEVDEVGEGVAVVDCIEPTRAEYERVEAPAPVVPASNEAVQQTIDMARRSIREMSVPPGAIPVPQQPTVRYTPDDLISQTEAKRGLSISADRYGRRRVFRDGSQLVVSELAGMRFTDAQNLNRIDAALNRRTWAREYLRAAEVALKAVRCADLSTSSTSYQFSGFEWDAKMLGQPPRDSAGEHTIDAALARLTFLVRCRRAKLATVERELMGYGVAV